MGQLDKTTEEVQEVCDQQLTGDEAVNVGWDDLTTSLIGRRLTSNAGSVDYDWEESAIAFSPSGDITDINDCVIWNLQKPHGANVTEPLMMHFHWEQISTSDLEFTLWRRIQSNNAAKTTAWTEVIVSTNTNNVFTYPAAGTFNQITKLAPIDWSLASLSSTVQFRLTRSDAVAGAVLVTFVDGHVATDQERGSPQEYSKDQPS